MNYRKLKKEYLKKFGVMVTIKLYKKQGEKEVIVKKASILVTAKNMRSSLIKAKPYLGIYAYGSKYDNDKN